MLKNPRRQRFWQRQSDMDFTVNKGRVVRRMLGLLNERPQEPEH
jgi:hypothetical protein